MGALCAGVALIVLLLEGCLRRSDAALEEGVST
jgi:hypothetical protein